MTDDRLGEIIDKLFDLDRFQCWNMQEEKEWKDSVREFLRGELTVSTLQNHEAPTNKKKELTKITVEMQTPDYSECKTPGAHYTTHISPEEVSVAVKMPRGDFLSLTRHQAIALEAKVHLALEKILEPYFNDFLSEERAQ